MELIYENFEGLNIDDEIEKIKFADLVNVKINIKDKSMLFLLGVLFAANKKIKVINKEELDYYNNVDLEIKKEGKSFIIMTYVWEKLFDDNFPKKDFSNVNSEFDTLIENVKRLKPSVINNSPIENKLFLICPVRKATKDQIKEMEEYINTKIEEGFIVHAPHLHTVQKDKFGGYAICVQNANGMATSSEVQIYYDQTSTGTLFDLGVAYYLEKPLKIINEDKIVYSDTDFGDKIVKNWNIKELPVKKLLK